MAEQWLSIVEYARTFSISDMTVRRRIKTGKLHAVLKDGKYYIPVKGESKSVRSIDHSEAPPTQRYPRTHGQVVHDMVQSNDELEIIRAHQANDRVQHSSKPVLASQTQKPRFASEQEKTTALMSKRIPEEIREPLQAVPQMTLKGDALLGFCEGVLGKLQGYEDSLKQAYESKIKTLEAQLSQKTTELSQLNQQVEDLQVLVKILEKRA